jgi:protein-S-isoprenylcysteine O-methyltransferase Ste14
MDIKNLEKTYNNPLMKIPVPWVFVLVYCIGLDLQFLFPLTIVSAESFWKQLFLILGWVLFVIGLFLAGWALKLFGDQKTTTVKFNSSSTLVTWGPYKLSRNPMYVGLSAIYLSIAFTHLAIWPSILFVAMLVYLHVLVVRIEEKKLQTNFGKEYEEYCKKVRRWL